ncbi:aminopeptidase N [Arcanobacterium hippocoleae]|uniref:Aminopeptidase N n=1 Tax=Arcanobacterium hippocoleae TaxID=149017 RepID=A0ABU1T075_9ACTO|nr:aminopeptidase N [Arcanobacterium hippocoleae]MDR6938781.1 aminopeptidase N [Arcanobacterium hippocoleae]
MSENLTREIAQYRSELLKIEKYKIELDVSEAQSKSDNFTVTSQISLIQLHEGSFHIDFIGDSVQAVCIDDQEIDFQYDGARITFAALTPGAHEIMIAAKGKYSTSGEGLHRFRDPLDSETYLYTQFEPADARRVFPNFEQPDLKAEFAIAITAPAAWTVLSNGAEIHSQPAGENSQGKACKRVIFATTKRMSTYLTAFIGGPYHKFSDVYSGPDGDIALGYYCRETLAEYFDFADINTVTKQGLDIFPQAFGMPYQWGKYDSVFVPEYNLGAMENPGCVTFNENMYIHRGHTTRAQAASRGNTILHEMSHMWFGDLVTPKWWDDLWLKESFAEYMGAWGLVNGTKYDEAWEAFTGARLAWALANDQYPTTHPIIANVPDLEAADQVFDGITYAKGAAVLRQLVSWLGTETFFAGTRLYFAKHAFEAATFGDLLAALSEASGKDVQLWAKEWFETPGVSQVEVTRLAAGVQLKQIGTDPFTGEDIRRPHLINVSGWQLDDHKILQRVADTNIELIDEVMIPWENLGGSEVAAILPNDGGLSYLKISFDRASCDAFLNYDVNDSLSRAVIANALWQEVRDAKLKVAKYLEYVMRNAALKQSALLNQMLKTALQAIKDYLPVQQRKDFAAKLFTTGMQQITEFAETEDLGVIWRHTIAELAPIATTGTTQIRTLLHETTDQELRWALLTALANMNLLADGELAAELEKSHSAKDELAYLGAKASIPGTQHETLALLLQEDAKLSNLEIGVLAAGFMAATTPAAARAALPNFFERIDQIWRSRSQEIAERIIYGIFPRTEIMAADPDAEVSLQREAKNWLAAGGHESALVKIIRDCLDDSYRCAKAQKFNS